VESPCADLAWGDFPKESPWVDLPRWDGLPGAAVRPAPWFWGGFRMDAGRFPAEGAVLVDEGFPATVSNGIDLSVDGDAAADLAGAIPLFWNRFELMMGLRMITPLTTQK
jgi:hypothetical protein